MADVQLILAWDRTDAEAPARRAAAMARHVAHITAEAEAGRLRFGAPLLDAEGVARGSLLVTEDAERHLAGEPFAALKVWRRARVLPFRIAALPWARGLRPPPSGPGASHTVLIARDGTDAEAEARRLAARPAHFARMAPHARSGLLAFGGAVLDPATRRMTGSVAVTRHASRAEAEAFWAEDPYMREGVWRELDWHGARLRALPWPPLPRPVARRPGPDPTAAPPAPTDASAMAEATAGKAAPPPPGMAAQPRRAEAASAVTAPQTPTLPAAPAARAKPKAGVPSGAAKVQPAPTDRARPGTAAKAATKPVTTARPSAAPKASPKPQPAPKGRAKPGTATKPAAKPVTAARPSATPKAPPKPQPAPKGRAKPGAVAKPAAKPVTAARPSATPKAPPKAKTAAPPKAKAGAASRGSATGRRR